MKKSALLISLLALPAMTLAQTIVVGTASGPAGGAATTGVPIPVTFTPNATPTAANTVRDIDVRLTFNATNLTGVTFGAGTIAGGSCTAGAAGTVIVAVPDTGAAIAAGTICNITAVNIAAAAPASNPLTLASGVGSGCSNAAAAKVPCTYTSGAVNVVVANTPPTLTLGPASVTLTGGAGNVPINVTGAGIATASVALGTANCSVTPAGFTVGTLNFTSTAPATVANGVAQVPLTCTPGAAAVNGTLSCIPQRTPGGPAPAITSPVVCPQIGASSVAQGPATLAISAPTGGTGTGNITLTAPAANPQAVVVACTAAAPLSIAGSPFTVAAGATVNVPVTFTAGAAGAQTITCTTATANATVTGSTAVTTSIATVNLTPGTAPGAVNLGNATVGGTPAGTSLTFTPAGIVAPATASLACVVSAATGAGTFAATPNPLNFTANTAGTVSVTYSATGAGAASATLTCIATGASGGPFVYNLAATGVASAITTIPTLGTFGMLLLVAGFLGLGVTLARRQA
jgi:hypothetical protein